jgi:hypothetical protein
MMSASMNLSAIPLRDLLPHASRVEMLPHQRGDSTTISTDTSLPNGTVLILWNEDGERNIVVIVNTDTLRVPM